MLVPNVSRAWRWFSVQAMTIAAAANVVWVQLPPDLKESVPSSWLATGTAVLMVLGVIGRMVDQDDG